MASWNGNSSNAGSSISVPVGFTAVGVSFTGVARIAAKHGLDVELLRRDVHEYARKAPIHGLIVALRRVG